MRRANRNCFSRKSSIEVIKATTQFSIEPPFMKILIGSFKSNRTAAYPSPSHVSINFVYSPVVVFVYVPPHGKTFRRGKTSTISHIRRVLNYKSEAPSTFSPSHFLPLKRVSAFTPFLLWHHHHLNSFRTFPPTHVRRIFSWVKGIFCDFLSLLVNMNLLFIIARRSIDIVIGCKWGGISNAKLLLPSAVCQQYSQRDYPHRAQ